MDGDSGTQKLDENSAGKLFDASQYAFFGNEIVDEVELGGLEEDDDILAAGIEEELQVEPEEAEGIGSFPESDDLAAAFSTLLVSNNPLGQNDRSCPSNFLEDPTSPSKFLVTKATEFLTKHASDISPDVDSSNFIKLVRNKYFMSLARPGEAVGVIAAQSVGEPSTQMTLNTSHQAGRGAKNVTLGIPRLQEIIMTASVNMKTPTMTCPLPKNKEKDDAVRLAAKLKRITVADVVEDIDVCFEPLRVDNNVPCSIYKIRVKLSDPKLYVPFTDITLEDCHYTLESDFAEDLRAAMENHLLLLEKINVISSVYGPMVSSDVVEDSPESNKAYGGDGDDDDGEGDEVLSGDARKAKRQTKDDLDYEDNDVEESKSKTQNEDEMGSEDEKEEENKTKELDKDGMGAGDELEGMSSVDDEGEVEQSGQENLKDEGEVEQSEQEKLKEIAEPDVEKASRPDSTARLRKRRRKGEDDRVVICHVESKGLNFDVHFKLMINEPYIVLQEIAAKTAQKVYVKSAGKIEQCNVAEFHLDELPEGVSPKDYDSGGIPMLRKGKDTRSALQTAGLDFPAFWEMQDDLDVRFISTNDINAMLNTYGVEAARATIITEMFTLFGHYGVTVDMRHLSLIADSMTHNGGYRPMSRSGGIADLTSTLSKMSYESASKFLTEGATFGLVDNLETPSARICLGLPTRVGTGCFDVLHLIDA